MTHEIGCGEYGSDPKNSSKKDQNIDDVGSIHKNKLSEAQVFVKAFFHQVYYQEFGNSFYE